MEKTKNARGWAVVIVSFLILMLIFATCVSCMGVYLKPVTEDFGISRTSFSLITTIQALAMLLSAMAAGKMLEKYNIKKMMVAGVIACGCCLMVYAMAPSIMWFYVASIFMGVSISFTCNIPVSILIKSWFCNGNEGTALGIAFVGSGVGAMILNPLYTYIIENFGWRYSFGFAGICVLVILVPLVLFIVSRNPEESSMESGRNVVGHSEADFTLSEAVRNPQTWFVFLSYIILTFVGMGVLNHGVPFMTDCGMSAETAAMVISTASAVLIGGKILAGRMYDKLGVYKMNIIEACLLLVCFTAFWLSGYMGIGALMILFVMFYGIGMPVGTISMQLTIPYMYGKSNFGSIMGMFSMANGIGGMLQIVISMIYDKTGSYYPAWILMSILCAAVIIIFSLCAKPLKKYKLD